MGGRMASSWHYSESGMGTLRGSRTGATYSSVQTASELPATNFTITIHFEGYQHHAHLWQLNTRRKTEILRKGHLDMLCCAKQMHIIITPEQSDTPCKKFQMKYGMIHISKTSRPSNKA